MTTNPDPKPLSETTLSRVNNFLKEHDCGNRSIDNYGDDWSHYDIESFVDLALALEKELNEANKTIKILSGEGETIASAIANYKATRNTPQTKLLNKALDKLFNLKCPHCQKSIPIILD